MCCSPSKLCRGLHTALSRGSPNYQPRVWGTETGSAFVSCVAFERTLSWCKPVRNLLSEHQQLCASEGSLQCLQPSLVEWACIRVFGPLPNWQQISPRVSAMELLCCFVRNIDLRKQKWVGRSYVQDFQLEHPTFPSSPSCPFSFKCQGLHFHLVVTASN